MNFAPNNFKTFLNTYFHSIKMNIKSLPFRADFLLFGIKSSFLIIFIYLFVVNSWMNDDAYITFRMIDNFIHGYGLRWNIAERVYINIHPLWMFLISVFYFFSKEPYFTTLLISFFLSSITLFILWKKCKQNISLITLSSLLLFSSKAYIDFCSSGLENPLSYLLCSIFFTTFLFGERQKNKPHSILFYFTIATLCFLTRFDTILIYLPSLIFLLYSHYRTHGKWNAFEIGIAISPAVLWFLFSLTYFGFFFPNVYYAKLNTNISLLQRIFQGFYYFKFSFFHDPITPAVILMGILIGFRSKQPFEKLTVIGIIFYLLYIFKIGADFMSGRFFTVPYLISVILIIRYSKISNKGMLACILFLIIYNIQTPRAPFNSGKDYQKKHSHNHDSPIESGVTDDRLYYHNASSLLHYNKNINPFPNMSYSQDGLKLKKANIHAITVNKSIGYLGYFSGPTVFIIDHYGLSDPLLARIPGKKTKLIGHNFRFIPEGYLQSQQTGTNIIEDTKLRELYNKIRMVTRGKLFTWQRWRYIIELNFDNNRFFKGQYKIDHSYK